MRLGDSEQQRRMAYHSTAELFRPKEGVEDCLTRCEPEDVDILVVSLRFCPV